MLRQRAYGIKGQIGNGCRRRVDWDKVEAEVKAEEKDEKLDGDQVRGLCA